MIEIETDKKEIDSFEKFNLTLEEKRTYWAQRISEFGELLKNINQITQLQVEIYSARQILLEDKFKLMDLIQKINSVWRTKWIERFNHYTFNTDYRYDKEAKDNMIGNDLQKILAKKEVLKSQLEWTRDTISTIDNIIYGIKYRIQLEEWKINN
jgi:hypothetical protein